MHMKFYGQFSPPVDQFLFEHFFENNRRESQGFFIECGAFDGVIDSCCKFFEETLGWKGINIEAAPPIYEVLKKNRPESININAALSNYDGHATFTHAIHPELGVMFGNGSLNHSKKHKEELDNKGCKYEQFDVEVMTYKSLIERLKIEKIDLFVLDVEGNELNVLDGMRNCSIYPEVFCIEFGNLEKEAIIGAVEALGYRYVCESYVNAFFVLDK